MIIEVLTNQFRRFWEQFVPVFSFDSTENLSSGQLMVTSPSLTLGSAPTRTTLFHGVTTASITIRKNTVRGRVYPVYVTSLDSYQN